LFRFFVNIYYDYQKQHTAYVKAEFSPIVLSKKAIEFNVRRIIVGKKIRVGKFYKWPEFFRLGFTGRIKKTYLVIREDQRAQMKQAPGNSPAIAFNMRGKR